MTHHTKNKGDIGVAKIICDLTEKGYIVCTPLTEHSPFDLIVYSEDRGCIKVQVKYRAVDKFGAVSVPLKTSWADKNGTHIKKYNLDTIDVFAIYCPDIDECFYFAPEDGRTSYTFRVNESRKDDRINYVKDFKDLPPTPTLDF